METLESRTLLSVTAHYSGSQLVVDGDNSGNTIRVDEVTDGVNYYQRISYLAFFDHWIVVGDRYGGFTSMLINSGAGNDVVDIDAVLVQDAPITINGVDGQDVVNLNSLPDEGAPVNVQNPGGYTDLNVTAPLGSFQGCTTTVGQSSLTFTYSAPPTFVVNYVPGDISHLNVSLGNSSGNSVVITGTPSASQNTTIQTGTGGTSVQVNGNTTPVTISDHGNDGVTVGATGHLTNIQAPVSVNANPAATDLFIDDVFDPAAQTVSITNNTVSFGNPFAPIHYSNLRSLTVQRRLRGGPRQHPEHGDRDDLQRRPGPGHFHRR
jgi:hypothetical protein